VNKLLKLIIPILSEESSDDYVYDNALGSISRIISGQSDNIQQYDQVVLLFIEKLPLRKDMEEYEPIFECLMGLISKGNSAITKYMGKVIKLFAGQCKEQDNEMKKKIKNCLKYLEEKYSKKIYSDLSEDEIGNLKDLFQE
jgi:hypothetical protein